jgi:LacI family transcriptional regulator
VSNVLNRPDQVAASTRARVEAVVEELGFIRNASANQLRTGRHQALGLVVLDIGNPFFTEVARGAEAAAREADCVLVLGNSDSSAEQELRNLHTLAERADGIIVSPVDEHAEELERLGARGTPLVLLDRRSPRGRHCSVSVDDVLGGLLAAEHLFQLGHDRLTVISGPLTLQQCADRVEGAHAAATAAGHDPERAVRVVEVDNMTARDGRACVAALGDDVGAAVFCTNDLLALGALASLQQAGHRVGEDVALVGYDDIAFAADAAVPLSSVRQPMYELGYRACQTVLAEIAEGPRHRHQQIVFQPELVIRESSRPRPVPEQ